jgi:hypothetical protein
MIRMINYASFYFQHKSRLETPFLLDLRDGRGGAIKACALVPSVPSVLLPVCTWVSPQAESRAPRLAPANCIQHSLNIHSTPLQV